MLRFWDKHFDSLVETLLVSIVPGGLMRGAAFQRLQISVEAQDQGLTSIGTAVPVTALDRRSILEGEETNGQRLDHNQSER
jgi:hypothetical protein